jgi:colanic acid/amylovoran biosynthesis glycosyltransferase
VKVTFCSYDKPDSVGGPTTWIQTLLPALRDRGIEVRCLFLLHWGTTGPALSGLQKAGIPCDAVRAHDTTEERIEWILARLAENPPDVFVPNLVVAAFFAARVAREAGIATVGVLHSDDPFYRALVDEFVLGDPAFRVSGVVSVSRELERQLESGDTAGVTLRRIPYGVTVPASTVRRQEERLRIAYVGRLAEEQKRISGVASAFCAAASEMPALEATIYGDGPDRDAVGRILSSNANSDRVRLHGPVDRAELTERLLETDVIVLLSDYEGLPISLLEAMAHGCVPVCLNIRSGIPELVEDGKTGLLVSDRGPDFVRAIRTLHDDASLWTTLSKEARATVVSGFSEQNSANSWAAFLRDVAPSPAESRTIPSRSSLKLPPVHPALASADARRQITPATTRLYRSSRMFAGRLRRALFDILAPGSR